MDDGQTDTGSTPGGRRPDGRAGFTLFEVAISMLIVSFAVVSVMMVFPVGLRQQQTVRSQILASTRVLQLVDSFASNPSINRQVDFELPRPWEGSAFCYSNTRWDLEARLQWDSGIIPLPLAIARRLDSDGDEIQAILDAGGMIYYADPGSMPSIDYRYPNTAPPNEAQKLVFAVTGLAQHNAITVFPYKAWPYRAAYPSPPIRMEMKDNPFPPKQMCTPISGSGKSHYLMEGWCHADPGDGQLPSRDPLMVDVFNAFDVYWVARSDMKMPLDQKLADQLSTDLVKVVLAYCQDKHKQMTSRLGSTQDEYARYIAVGPGQDYVGLGRNYDDEFAALCRQAESIPTRRGDLLGLAATRARMRSEIALRVQCFRFLAQAMTTFNQALSDKATSGVGLRGSLPAVQPIKGIAICKELLQYYHERSLATVMRYAATFPYDWGAPRPLGRAIMMDQPLFEFDLFTPPHSGTITGSNKTAAMWKPIAAQALTSPGLPAMYPGAMVGSTFKNDTSPFPAWSDRGPNRMWGDPRHFTLTRAFDPYERCRQIVFWSVDWRSYEDAETTPSAPVDASRAPIRCLRANDKAGNYNTRCYAGSRPGTRTDYDAYYLGNLERTLGFIDLISDRETGSDMTTHLLQFDKNPTKAETSKDMLDAARFVGAYGADRNHNYRLDRGPINASQRLRAVRVTRFNYYDPRIPISTR